MVTIHQSKKRLEYLATCKSIMANIRKYKSNFIISPKPMTAARQFEIFFTQMIPDPNARFNKLRLLFQEKFHEGDDLYLRVLYEIVKSQESIAMYVGGKYMAEHREYAKAIKNSNKNAKKK